MEKKKEKKEWRLETGIEIETEKRDRQVDTWRDAVIEIQAIMK